MTTKNNPISRLCGLALGGLLVGLPATAALAADAEPTTAAEAQAKAEDYSQQADHYRKLAAHYRLQGGVAYKAGLVRWAEEDQQRAEAKQQAAEAKQQKYETAPVPAAPSSDAPNSGP